MDGVEKLFDAVRRADERTHSHVSIGCEHWIMIEHRGPGLEPGPVECGYCGEVIAAAVAAVLSARDGAVSMSCGFAVDALDEGESLSLSCHGCR